MINETAARQRKRRRPRNSERNRNLSNSRKCPSTVHSKFANISEKEEREILAELDRIFHPKQE